MLPAVTEPNAATPDDDIRLAVGGPAREPVPDIAWAPPRDPLDKRAIDPRLVRREVPISVVATAWDVPQARSALSSLVLGLFDAPAQLCDSVMGSDSRVQAALAARLSILRRPVSFRIPKKYRDSSAARECRDAFEAAWPVMAPDAAMGEIMRWGTMLGFGPAQILWDTSGDYAIPRPVPWHPRYVYFHWLYRCYVAITLDGQEAIIPGDGSWMLHAPFGAYRGWMRGAVRAITPWWLSRNYALRDWSRYSERHGLPMIKAKSPAVGDPSQIDRWRAQLANLGQETVIQLPQNPPPALSFDVELMEAKDTEHEGFRMLIEQCNQEITLSLLAQTLTTSMPAEGGSSYAAARVHAGVLQGLMEGDAQAEGVTVYRDLARPFAALNFGEPDLAPYVTRDVTPFEDAKTKAQSAQALGAFLVAMRTAGFMMSPRDVRKMFRDTIPGFDPGRILAVEPMQIEAQATRAGAKVEADGAEAMPAPDGGKPSAGGRRLILPGDASDDVREALAMRRAA